MKRFVGGRSFFPNRAKMEYAPYYHNCSITFFRISYNFCPLSLYLPSFTLPFFFFFGIIDS